MRGIENQFLSLRKGFHELIPVHLLKAFDERELEVNGPFLGLFFGVYFAVLVDYLWFGQNRHY